MQTEKKMKLTQGQQFRAAVTAVALHAQDRLENGKAIRTMEDAFRRAMDRKLEENPRFAWQVAA